MNLKRKGAGLGCLGYELQDISIHQRSHGHVEEDGKVELEVPLGQWTRAPCLREEGKQVVGNVLA